MVLRVAALYHIWPHYRAAVMAAMDESEAVAYTFMAGGEHFEGILHIEPSSVKTFEKAPFRQFGRFGWQWAALALPLSNRFDLIIYLGDPNILSTWVGAAIARVRGVPTLFWAHGWRRRQSRKREFVRNMFFRIANGILVYSPRGRAIGIDSGFPAERITTVYNSLDIKVAEEVVASIEAGALATVDPRSYFSEPNLPLVTCSARITRACRFDLLVEAAAQLAAKDCPINILLVGDGPERDALESLANERGVKLKCYGACYDEKIVGQIIYHADVVVSPGKIGLTAMHSLMYGTPAITHSNFDEQMPEFEAIEDGKTGAFFTQNDSASLAETIMRWLQSAPDRAVTRAAAWKVIRERWSPEVQASILESAIIQTYNRVRRK